MRESARIRAVRYIFGKVAVTGFTPAAAKMLVRIANNA